MNVRTVDLYHLEETMAALKEAVESDELAVIIAEHPCPLLKRKEGGLQRSSYAVDQDKCVRCHTCVSRLSCPAISKDGRDVRIDVTMCIGCGVCAQVCPKDAIEVVR